jgi:membrane protein implicated in regulation of membrane protease activity
LSASGVLFAVLWLSDIVPAVASGTAPLDVVEVGLPVNPVHVLDLAFVLPAMIVTAVLLWKRNPFGLFFAVPLMTFAAAMGAAIIGMSVVMNSRGLGDPNAVIAGFVVLVAVAVALTYVFLRRTRRGPDHRSRDSRGLWRGRRARHRGRRGAAAADVGGAADRGAAQTPGR